MNTAYKSWFAEAAESSVGLKIGFDPLLITAGKKLLLLIDYTDNIIYF